MYSAALLSPTTTMVALNTFGWPTSLSLLFHQFALHFPILLRLFLSLLVIFYLFIFITSLFHIHNFTLHITGRALNPLSPNYYLAPYILFFYTHKDAIFCLVMPILTHDQILSLLIFQYKELIEIRELIISSQLDFLIDIRL